MMIYFIDPSIFQLILNNNKNNNKISKEIQNYNKTGKEASNGFSNFKDKVTLVNYDMINKAKINHFENNLPFKKENENNESINGKINNDYEEYKIEKLHNNNINNKNTHKNNYDHNNNNQYNNKISSSGDNYDYFSKSPGFASSYEHNNQEHDLTFKNGKSNMSFKSTFYIIFFH